NRRRAPRLPARGRTRPAGGSGARPQSRAPEPGTTTPARGSPATRRGVRRTRSRSATPRTARSRRKPPGAGAREAADARATRGCGCGRPTPRRAPPPPRAARTRTPPPTPRGGPGASPPPRAETGAVASVGLLLLGRLLQGLMRDGLLELTHPGPERASDLRQPLGAEEAERDQEQEREVRGAGQADHSCSSLSEMS